MSTRRALPLAAACLAVALSLTGCAGDDDHASSAPAGALDGTSAGADGPQADGSGRGGGTTTQRRAVPGVTSEVRTATLTVRVADIPRALRAAEDAAVRAGGLVAGQEVRLDPELEDGSSGEVVLRVPNDRLTATIRDLQALGTVLSSDGRTEDVTAQVIDVQARVATQRRSLERIRRLLDRAASVDEIVKIESELARREADLESLLGQQRVLSDRTAMATLTARFTGTAAAATDDGGFLPGLRAGWEAFVAMSVVGLTVLGATLPFLLAAAILAVPAALVARGRLRRRRPAEG